MASKKKKNRYSVEEVEQITIDAMRENGMLPPTVREVAALDQELPNLALPFSPVDPESLLGQLDSSRNDQEVISIPLVTSDTDASRNLARAARQGGELTQKIEDRMAEDKAKFLNDEQQGE